MKPHSETALGMAIIAMPTYMLSMLNWLEIGSVVRIALPPSDKCLMESCDSLSALVVAGPRGELYILNELWAFLICILLFTRGSSSSKERSSSLFALLPLIYAADMFISFEPKQPSTSMISAFMLLRSLFGLCCCRSSSPQFSQSALPVPLTSRPPSFSIV